MKRLAAAALCLIALPAMADSYRQECQTIAYGKDDIRTTCTDTYTPTPKPFVPQSLHLAPGTREDIRVPVRGEAVAARPTTVNHCGAGYRYGAIGCEPVR